MARKPNSNRTNWTPERNKFLQDNFSSMTNQQLADTLGLKLTVVRNQTRALGLKRYDFDNWTVEETQFLIDNYSTMGDVEIMETLMQRRPDRVPMNRRMIRKKRGYLKLCRTPEQIKAITAKYYVPGGRSYTIFQNSGAVNLPDSTVAAYMSKEGYHVNQDLKNELLQHPVLLDIKRRQIQLSRSIKEAQK